MVFPVEQDTIDCEYLLFSLFGIDLIKKPKKTTVVLKSERKPNTKWPGMCLRAFILQIEISPLPKTV